MPPIVIGEDFQAFSCHALTNTVVAGPMRIEGDAPNRFFEVRVRNTGRRIVAAHTGDVVADTTSVAVQAQESVDGTTWTLCNDRANSGAAGIYGLAAGAEGSFDFLVSGSGVWFRLVAHGIAPVAMKLEAISRAPVNA